MTPMGPPTLLPSDDTKAGVSVVARGGTDNATGVPAPGEVGAVEPEQVEHAE